MYQPLHARLQLRRDAMGHAEAQMAGNEGACPDLSWSVHAHVHNCKRTTRRVHRQRRRTWHARTYTAPPYVHSTIDQPGRGLAGFLIAAVS